MEKKQRKPRIHLSPKVLDKLQGIAEVLKKRGAKKIELGELVERLFGQESSTRIIDEFVSEKTPTEYKLKALLKDPAAKDQLLGVIGDKHFGVTFSSQRDDASL